MSLVLVYIFSICIALQVLYAIWFLWYMGGKTETEDAPSANINPVSVIICAKNEAQALARNLPKILEQKHPQFEVIVVNDAATDDTLAVLQECATHYDQLRWISVDAAEERLFLGKKHALSKGVAAASYEHLLLTDADCVPASENWLALMTAGLQQGSEIVAGVGSFGRSSGPINIFTRWETLHTFIQYSTYTNSGIPYMAVGRNLAVMKRCMEKAQQDPFWRLSASGDDDLLVQICAQKHNMKIQANPASFTMSQSKTSFKDYIAQKQRHLSTGKLYHFKQQLLLSLYALSHSLMWLLFPLLVFTGHTNEVGSLMLLRCLIYWGLWAIAAKQLQMRRLIPFFPILDVSLTIYNLILSPYIIYKTKKQWS